MNTVTPMYKWSDISWQKLEKNVYKLQKRIFKASHRGDVKLVRRLQKLLIKSWAAKCLAVRRVTQDNQGRKTAGVDGVLKAGAMDGLELKPTPQGTPQGGTISPLLANIALHGMENMIKKLAESFDMKRTNGKHQLSMKDKKRSVSLIRYADDFVIFHKDINILKRCKKAITQWLNDIGLELKPSKTRIAHTLKEHKNEQPGFNFLGFNIRQYKAGKYISGKNGNGKTLGFKTIITPSKISQKEHYKKIVEVIKKHKGKSQTVLIKNLNPIIRGWSNYFSTACCSKVFRRLDYIIIWKLYKWGIKRHPNKGKKWVKTKYFQKFGSSNWVFSTRAEDNPMQLVLHSDTKNNRYVKVKEYASPYDGNLIYWSSRQGKHPEMPKRTAFLLKKQKGKCNWCKLIFRENDVIETDHIIPTAAGGKDEYKNLQLLHRHCHDEKTKSDLEVINNHRREKRIKELYKWFNKLDWIWKDDIPTMV